jgi:hypothetical protein
MRGEPLYDCPKPGSVRVERAAKSLKRRAKEDAAGAAAKKRDWFRCVWPHQTAAEREACRRSSWKEAMHWKAKGMGGNPDGTRNVRRNLVTGCPDVHQGPTSIHAGKKRIRALTPDLMDGARAFDEKVGGKWIEVGHETSCGVLA